MLVIIRSMKLVGSTPSTWEWVYVWIKIFYCLFPATYSEICEKPAVSQYQFFVDYKGTQL